ncbi:hypothetical protein [Frondihabitans sp. VKM Ac-2883]|uniref:hypothetical protein n=1 Tax=Frondihabitans sp. VKM Ac-2883 TaxID=2783823 RepID=UPI00188BB50C|nr:hypothetical protein [Frondihabitans sp. VKM Ac-2883]MBF4577307.1 hypothetical protein [Frondihabitans sp. VKM Ac-2883]
MSDTPYPPKTGADDTGTPGTTAPALGRLDRAVRDLRPVDWIAAALTGVGAFVVAYLVAVVSLLLTTALVVASSGSSGSTGSGSAGGSIGDTGGDGIPAISGLITAVTVIFGAPAQLVALADFGRLSIHGSVTVIASVSGSIHIGVVPVLVLVAQLVALVLGVRLFRSRRLDLLQSAVASAVTGASLALVALVVGLALAIRLPKATGFDISGITAVNALAVIAAFVLGSFVALLARPAWFARMHPVLSQLLGTVRVAALHFGVLLVVVMVGVIIYAAVAHPDGASALPLVIGNVAVIAIAIGFFGGVSVSESAGSLMSTLSGSSSGAGAGSGTATVFSGGSVTAWLLVLLVVLTAVVSGLALAVRRNRRDRTVADWVATAVVYALLGLMLQVFGTAVFSVQIAGVGGAGSAGVTPWTIAVLAAWGIAIEAVARYLAPLVLPAATPGLLRVTRRFIGRDLTASGPGASAGTGQMGAGQMSDGQMGAGEAGAEPAIAAEPMSPRKRRILVRSLIAGGIVLVLVVGGAITAGTLRSTVYGPGHAAEAYLAALSSGDADAAGRLSGATGTGKGMLTTKVLSSAKDRIRDVAVGNATVSGDLASVKVSYRQGGESHDSTLKLTRTGTSWLIHDKWAVTSSLAAPVSIATASALGDADVTVDGVKVGTTKEGTLTLSAFPGTYSIAVAGTKYFEASSKSVTVTADGYAGSRLEFAAAPTSELKSDAKTLVTDLIAKCAKATTGELDDACPFYGPGSDATKVSYKVTSKPTLSVDLTYDGTVVVTGDGGKVDMKYTRDFFGSNYKGGYEQSMYIYKSLTIQGDKLVLIDR